MERLVVAAQPVRPDRLGVQLGVGCVQLRGDVGEAGRERFGLADLVVEHERAAEALFGRSLHQGGLQGGESGPAHLLGPRLRAQELRGLERGVGDVHAYDLVGGTDSPVDGLREGQGERPAAEGALGVVFHARDQLARYAGLVLIPELPQPGRGRHVEAAQRRDLLVVVDDRPRLPDPARNAVGLVHHDQVPSGQTRSVRPLQRAQTEAGVRGVHGHLVQAARPLHQLVHIRGVGEGHLLTAQRGDPDHRPPAASLAPRGLGLGEQVQRGYEHQHTARVELLRAADRHPGLPGPGRHDHLRSKPSFRHK